MGFIFIFFFLHLHQILSNDLRVKKRLAIDLDEDKHPDQNIIAGGYFIQGEELNGQLLKCMFAAYANMFPQNRKQRFFGSVHNNFVPSFVDPLV